MAQLQLKTIRTGGVTMTGDSVTTFTAASGSLARLTAGMADGDLCYVDVIAAFFNFYDYSTLVRLTVCIRYNSAGPTYTLGAVTSSTVNSGPTGSIVNSITLDQSGGELRVRALLGNGVDTAVTKCYAIFNTMGP